VSDPDGAGPPSADRPPRWQVEQDRVQRDTSPFLLWLYRQWWLYAVAALGMLGVALSAAVGGDQNDAFVPALVLGLLFLTFTIMAYRHRQG
jgi:hypothetical protein